MIENPELLHWLQQALYANAILWFVLTIAGIVDHILYPPLKSKDRTLNPHDDLISIIIPARNEEKNIERCVRSVCGQTHPHLEIIVVDDQSEDDTALKVEEIARDDSRVQLIRGADLPKGWVGKGWALCQGHRIAKGSWVLLLDADTELQTDAVHTALDTAKQGNIDFLNPTPRFVNRSFWEKAMQPLLWGFVMTRFPMMWVNARWMKENTAFGPFLLIRSKVYDAVGGHKHVCHDILEDVALSRLIKDSGYNTRFVNGMNLFNIRMYENFSQILEGWIKTAYGAMNYNILLMTLAIFGLFYLAMFPMVFAVLGAYEQLAYGSSVLLVPALLAVGSLYLRRVWDHFRFRFGFVSLWMHPISMIVVQYMQVAAVWRFHFGSLTWKGRAYKHGEGLMDKPLYFGEDDAAIHEYDLESSAKTSSSAPSESTSSEGEQTIQ